MFIVWILFFLFLLHHYLRYLLVVSRLFSFVHLDFMPIYLQWLVDSAVISSSFYSSIS